jgi:hypothetical protein
MRSEPAVSAAEQSPSRPRGGRVTAHAFWAALAARATGEPAIYGTVLVAGLVVVEGEYLKSTATLASAVVQGVLVTWAAHVFAATVSHAAGLGAEREPVRAALGHALAASSGLLLAAAVLAGLLALGAIGAIPPGASVVGALSWTAVALTGIGYVALGRTALRPWRRAAGSVVTAAVGLGLVALKAAAH